MKNYKAYIVFATIFFIVFILSFAALLMGDYLAATFNVIGIRISVLIVSFAAFGGSTFFSLMVYLHNKTVSRANDDSNKRAELFRELQFASSNYSIVEFTDRMLIQKESERYIKRFYKKDLPSFHMIQTNTDLEKPLLFYTIRIPFRVLEGKTAGAILLSQIRFEKDAKKFDFIPMAHEDVSTAYLLYNEKTQRKNLIINLVFNESSDYFVEDAINAYTKIKIGMHVNSILGVQIQGISELYFTNPIQVEGDGLHTYKINSSNFRLIKQPFVQKDDDYV